MKYSNIVILVCAVIVAFIASYAVVESKRNAITEMASITNGDGEDEEEIERISIITHAKHILHEYDKQEGVHAKYMDYDGHCRILAIEIGGYLTEGTDSACVYAASLFWNLAQIDDRMVIYVHGDFIPSKYNPLSYGWAKFLYYGALMIERTNDYHYPPHDQDKDMDEPIYMDTEVHRYN